MFCQICKTKIDPGEQACRICGTPVLTTGGISMSSPEVKAIILIDKHLIPKPIKCASCGFAGQGQFTRKMTTQIAALLAIFFFPIFPLLYFTFTYKYRCPQCKSNSLSIKNSEGQFESQLEKKRKTQKIFFTFLAVFLGLVLLLIVKVWN